MRHHNTHGYMRQKPQKNQLFWALLLGTWVVLTALLCAPLWRVDCVTKNICDELTGSRSVSNMTGQTGRPQRTGHEQRDISLIDSRLKLTSEHLLKCRTRSFTPCKRTTCVTTVKFPLVSHLASTTAVPSVWPSRLSHLSRHVLDWSLAAAEI